MRLIKQIHVNGCAIAALAMMTDLSYKKATKILHPRKKKYSRYGASFEAFVKAFYRLGYEATLSLKGKKDIISLKKNAILIIRGMPLHACVWNAKEKTIYDSSRDYPLHINNRTYYFQKKDSKRTITTKKYYEDNFVAYFTIRKISSR